MTLLQDLVSVPKSHKPVTYQELEEIQTQSSQEGKPVISETTGNSLL